MALATNMAEYSYKLSFFINKLIVIYSALTLLVLH